MNSIARLQPLPDLVEQLEHLRLHRHVERRHRLVGDQQLGLHGERAGDADALALAAGELVRIAVERVRDRAAPVSISLRARRQRLVARRPKFIGPSMIDCADRAARVQRAVRDPGRRSAPLRRCGRSVPADMVAIVGCRRGRSRRRSDRSGGRCSAPPSTCPSPIRRRCPASRPGGCRGRRRPRPARRAPSGRSRLPL